MREVLLVQLGVGQVGRALITQVRQAQLEQRYGLRLRYLALVDRTSMLATNGVLGDAALVAALAAKVAGLPLPGALPLQGSTAWRELLGSQPCIVVDTTAASGMEGPLAQVVAAGHRVVLANKRPLCGTIEQFQALTSHGATRYEATVGAGLPVISTLQSLLDSGDSLLRVEACLSGTLGYLCSELEAGASLSAAVSSARTLGYTEPDPRDDLDGGDVGRKALILARTAGLGWASQPVAAEPWFPASMAALPVDAFMRELPNLDAPFGELLARSKANGEVLRYVATVTTEGAEARLATLPASHPLAALRGPDNLVALTTARYHERPLIIRGPGAGADVTAAGVLGDIVATARELAGC